MIYQFDTEDKSEAVAALMLYAVYRSRDSRRFKVTPDMWSKIERFVKASAKRSKNIPDFLESLKPRLSCGAIHPKWMEVGAVGLVGRKDGFGHTEYIQRGDSREFLTGVLASCDQKTVIKALYNHTTYVVLLVRDRLEREKPVENELNALIIEEGEEL